MLLDPLLGWVLTHSFATGATVGQAGASASSDWSQASLSAPQALLSLGNSTGTLKLFVFVNIDCLCALGRAELLVLTLAL